MEPNLAMSTKITHLLDEDGQIAKNISSRSRNLINFLGAIVTSVSSSRKLRHSNPLQCRRYIAKKRCQGHIAAFCQNKNAQSPIEWFCWECGEGGLILDWQGTQFDQKLLRQKAEREHIQKGVWINDQRLDELLIPLETKLRGTHSLSYPTQRIVAERKSDNIVRVRIPVLLALELYRRAILPGNGEFISLRLGEKETEDYCYRDVKYPESGGEVIELEFSRSIDV